MIGLLFSFHYSRTHFVYKDNAAQSLSADLGEAFLGATGIKTNDLNAAAFAELDSLSSRYQDSLIIVPDYAAFWVTATYKNPLIMDWPNQGETQSTYFQEALEKYLIDNKEFLKFMVINVLSFIFFLLP